MRTAKDRIGEVADLLVSRFESVGHAQVEGYKRFVYVRHTDRAFTILREKGTEEDIPVAKLRKAVGAVRADRTIYARGPGALNEHVPHVGSPLWAILHLATLEELTA